MALLSSRHRGKSHSITDLKLFFLSALIFGALLALAAGSLWAQMPLQKPAGYVSDFAGVLSSAARAQLENLSTELDQKAHAQLAVVTVNSLEGAPLEDFTIELATRWGIGHRGKRTGDQSADRGVLLFLAVQDRRSRIEVGYGLEPIITDGRAGSILRSMTPYLRNQDYDSAVRIAAGSIAAIIAEDAGVTLGTPIPRPARLRSRDNDSPVSLGTVIVILLFLLPFMLLGRRRGHGGFWSGGPGWGGGGYAGRGGGFSGGGGGFGGFGGGSFGGGGASGSW